MHRLFFPPGGSTYRMYAVTSEAPCHAVGSVISDFRMSKLERILKERYTDSYSLPARRDWQRFKSMV